MATTTELEPGQGGLTSGQRLGWLPALTAAGARARLLANASRWPDLLAVVVLLGCGAVVYWPTINGASIYAESDSLTFFYPAFATLHQSVRDGVLPLWTPYIFGGFPLFAEGQIGALYPPNLLAAVLGSPLGGFLALRVFHVALALLGAYALARCLGASPLGGCVAGLAFGLGGFIVGQQHHASLLAAAAWLPWLLLCVELALRRRGWPSQVYLALAGLSLAFQALASHPQPLMLSGGLVVLYVIARQGTHLWASWPRSGSAAERRRAAAWSGLAGLWVLVVVPLLGAAVAAAQLVPLYELSQESWRAHGWSYRDAVEYSFPLINLVTLLFPFFFRSPDGGQWSLWQAWEVVLYVGVAPLCLGLIAVLYVRRWTVAFFGLVGLGSGLLALGGYAPFGLYEQVWTLPLVQLQRAPARFTLLTSLALAMLAAQGADWLAGGYSNRRRGLLVLQVAALVCAALLVGHLAVWRAWLHANQAWALRVLADWYVTLPHDQLQALSPLGVFTALDKSLDLANPKTAFPPALLVFFALLLVGWRELPLLAPLWRALLVLLVSADLALFAIDFHPLVAAESLADLGGPGEFLAAHPGPWRSLTSPEVTTTRPNQLLPSLAAEASGYSPLELDRYRRFGAAVAAVDNALLDLWNVRYVVAPADGPSLPSYQQVGYHPRMPIMSGGAGSPNGRLALRVPNEPATELRMVAALAGGAAIPDAEVVGEWVLTDGQGVRRVFQIRAGRDVADGSMGQPGARTAHRPVQVAGSVSAGDSPRLLSFAAIRLPDRLSITRLEYRHTNPVGQTVLYGVALFDGQTERLTQFFQPEKYALVYRDANAVIYENRSSFPRVFVVPEALYVPDGPAALARLTDGPFDPTRQVVLEQPGTVTSPPAGQSAAGRAELTVDDGHRIFVQASLATGGYLVLADTFYPGWRAYVDGQEVEVLRANYLFRAVAVPGGEHEIRFVFEPPSFRLGAAISAAGLLGTVGLVMASWLGPRLASRQRSRPEVVPRP